MPIFKVGKPISKSRGFSYAVVLVAIVVMAALAETAYLTTARVLRADREAELLYRGQAYVRAIRSYYEAGGAIKTFPPALEHLVNDPRGPRRRHLRALYDDPMSKDEKKAWRLLRAKDGGIAGVASSSNDEPLKQANFPKGLETFNGTRLYSEWVFEYRPAIQNVSPPRAAPTQPQGPPTVKKF